MLIVWLFIAFFRVGVLLGIVFGVWMQELVAVGCFPEPVAACLQVVGEVSIVVFFSRFP